jgi:hypothetical protein
MDTTLDKFHSAVLELVQPNPMKQRLIGAYRRHLVSVSEEHLPRESRESFATVIRALASVRPQHGEDAVAASVRKMSDSQAAEFATVILEIFAALSCAAGAAHRSAAANGSVVQLYPVESAADYVGPSAISRV